MDIHTYRQHSVKLEKPQVTVACHSLCRLSRFLFVFVDRTPTHNTHLCSTVCSQVRNASHACGSSRTDCSVIFVRLKRICHLVCTCLTLCCSLLCRLPRAHHLPHSLFLLPRHQNTQHNRHNKSNSENTSTSRTLQAHSGDKRRHQESLWRENMQSGGNPRTTTPIVLPKFFVVCGAATRPKTIAMCWFVTVSGSHVNRTPCPDAHSVSD